MATEVTCGIKHTKYQPPDEEWRCPWCGADNKEFYIEEPAADAASECCKLHEDDGLYCYRCEDGLSGKKFAAKLQKSKGLVTCTCCKGTGLVKGKS